MAQFVVSVGAFVLWVAFWAVAALTLTLAGAILASLLEYYLLVPKRRTRLLWICPLCICPAIAFWGSWTVLGLTVAEQSYGAVRAGGVAAGIVFAVVGLIVVTKTGEGKNRGGEIAGLAGSLVADALGCAALMWLFEPVGQYMRALGGG